MAPSRKFADLLKIATYTEFVMDWSLYLQRGMKYSELACWYEAEKLERLEKESLFNGTNLNSTGSVDHNISIFKVPAFHGNTLKGDKFI